MKKKISYGTKLRALKRAFAEPTKEFVDGYTSLYERDVFDMGRKIFADKLCSHKDISSCSASCYEEKKVSKQCLSITGALISFLLPTTVSLTALVYMLNEGPDIGTATVATGSTIANPLVHRLVYAAKDYYNKLLEEELEKGD